ncbi:MAG: hypothetical protein PUP93_11945 [Rhizonema sp. NSF051]|nr:hypothetical protein [Rhizonema sp. NSF051]
MNTHKVEAVLAEDRTLILRDLSFHAGDEATSPKNENRTTLL